MFFFLKSIFSQLKNAVNSHSLQAGSFVKPNFILNQNYVLQIQQLQTHHVFKLYSLPAAYFNFFSPF
jgi:hypothetical protein